jgi:hypothetical protein
MPLQLHGQEAQEAFMEIVENIEGVRYTRVGATEKRYEIAGNDDGLGKENLDKVLAHITGCATFEEAAAAVSVAGKSVVIDAYVPSKLSTLTYRVSQLGLDANICNADYKIKYGISELNHAHCEIEFFTQKHFCG